MFGLLANDEKYIGYENTVIEKIDQLEKKILLHKNTNDKRKSPEENPSENHPP